MGCTRRKHASQDSELSVKDGAGEVKRRPPLDVFAGESRWIGSPSSSSLVSMTWITVVLTDADEFVMRGSRATRHAACPSRVDRTRCVTAGGTGTHRVQATHEEEVS
jgi:hypothetical protein